jgi:hypothetical protein
MSSVHPADTDIVDLSGNGKGVSLDSGGSTAGIVVEDGVTYIPSHVGIGLTTDNVRYEMNAGGQPSFQEKVVHIASVGADDSVLEGFTFNNTAKPLTIQFGKNRGDGTVGSPTFGRKSLALDRIFLLSFYGGKDSDGTTTAFCHAGYLGATAEADNSGANELDTYVFLRPGSTSALPGAGNGLELNSKMQAAFPGPNITQYGTQQNHLAILRLGPGSTDIVPFRLTPSNLKTAPVEGGVELSSAGLYYITEGLTAGTLTRRRVISDPEITVASVASAAGTCTYTLVPGGIRIVLTVGGVDYSTVGVFITATFSSMPTTAVVVGSRDVNVGNLDAGKEFAFNAKSGNRIQISLLAGTMLASGVYNFNVIWHIP